MTDHPITPPPELVQEWREEALHRQYSISETEDHLIEQAAQHGADAELNACCKWMDYNCPSVGAYHLRADRRPKPPSLAEQGLEALRSTPCTEQRHYDALFAALERLKQLEGSND